MFLFNSDSITCGGTCVQSSVWHRTCNLNLFYSLNWSGTCSSAVHSAEETNGETDPDPGQYWTGEQFQARCWSGSPLSLCINISYAFVLCGRPAAFLGDLKEFILQLFTDLEWSASLPVTEKVIPRAFILKTNWTNAQSGRSCVQSLAGS